MLSGNSARTGRATRLGLLLSSPLAPRVAARALSAWSMTMASTGAFVRTSENRAISCGVSDLPCAGRMRGVIGLDQAEPEGRAVHARTAGLPLAYCRYVAGDAAEAEGNDL